MSLWCRTLSWHNALALASAASSGKTTSRALGVFLYVSVMILALVIIFTTTLAYAAHVPITQRDLRRRPLHLYDAALRRNGEWQIIASQAHRYYEDPAIGKIDPKKFGDFIGTYELAPNQTRSVTAEGENLFVERKGKKEQLFPETSDLFFRRGVEGRILFRYDAHGKIDALIDRRNNEDVVWRKTK